MYVSSTHKTNVKSHDCVYKLSEKEGNILSKQKEKKQKPDFRET